MDPFLLISSPVFEVARYVGEFAAEELVKRWKSAREEYKSRPPEELDTEFESRRRELLNQLSTLQTRAILEIQSQSLLGKFLPVFIELMLDVYEAKFEQELDMISRRIQQLESFLDRDKQDRDKRNNIRKSAVSIAVLAFILLFAGAIVAPIFGINIDYVIPILSIPLPIVMWSALGSITALLYRFNTSSEAELQNPMRWLVTRPITGIVMGIIAYLVVMTGLLASVPKTMASSITANELMWLVAFLAGFSDVFADGILKSLIGRFGGDKNAPIISQEDSSSLGDLTYKPIIGEFVQVWNKAKEELEERKGKFKTENQNDEITSPLKHETPQTDDKTSDPSMEKNGESQSEQTDSVDQSENDTK